MSSRDELFLNHGIHIDSKTLYLPEGVSNSSSNSGEVDGALVEYTYKGIHILERNTPVSKPLTIVMNNTGGSTTHGLAIYDMLVRLDCELIVHVYGHAMSMGSLILQAADTRLLAPHALLMIHDGTIDLPSNSMKSNKAWLDAAALEDEKIKRIMLDRMIDTGDDSNMNMKKLNHMMVHDKILTAAEAIRLGLADAYI